ncbi:unnamed protein product [Ambrosiozyma monospora]|uniref:Unnamed protein product n=1 Tax=Ambrosiozyma monospora TaxID=43982 RepID=A0ACB5SRA1_AMBMO|nr:unnamed protein product [Ambrosiozyma monospora]
MTNLPAIRCTGQFNFTQNQSVDPDSKFIDSVHIGWFLRVWLVTNSQQSTIHITSPTSTTSIPVTVLLYAITMIFHANIATEYIRTPFLHL